MKVGPSGTPLARGKGKGHFCLERNTCWNLSQMKKRGTGEAGWKVFLCEERIWETWKKSCCNLSHETKDRGQTKDMLAGSLQKKGKKSCWNSSYETKGGRGRVKRRPANITMRRRRQTMKGKPFGSAPSGGKEKEGKEPVGTPPMRGTRLRPGPVSGRRPRPASTQARSSKWLYRTEFVLSLHLYL